MVRITRLLKLNSPYLANRLASYKFLVNDLLHLKPVTLDSVGFSHGVTAKLG